MKTRNRSLSIGVLGLFLCGGWLMPVTAFAAVNTFQAGTSWNLAGNWSLGTVPASSDALLFDSTAFPATTTISNNFTADTLSFNNSGTMAIDANASGATARTLTLNNSAVNANGTSDIISLLGGGTINYGVTGSKGATTLALVASLNNINVANGGTFAFGTNTAISGTGKALSFTGNGSGQLVLSAGNSFTGGFTLTSGTVKIGNSAALGTTAGTLTLNGGTLDVALGSVTLNAYNTVVGGSATILSDRSSTGTGFAYVLGTLSIGANTLTINKGSNITGSGHRVQFGATTLTGNATFDNNGSTILVLGLSSNLSGNYDLTFQSTDGTGSTSVRATTASSRSSGVTTLSSGTLSLNSSTTGQILGTTATTLQLNGGTLDLQVDTGISAYPTTVGGNATILSDKATAGAGVTHTLGTLSIGAYTLTVSPGSGATSSSANLVFGGVTMTGDATFNVNSNATTTTTVNPGAITESGGSRTLTKSGTGALVVNASYTGGTVLNNGTISLRSAGCLGTGPLTINGGALSTTNSLALSTGTTQTWNGNFALSSGYTLNLGTGSVTLGAPTVIISPVQYGTLTVGGVISGAGKGIAIGSAVGQTLGTLSLSAVNTFDGGVTLNSGALSIGNISALGTGVFTINGGSISQTSGGALTGISGQIWNGNISFSCTAGAINLGTSPVTIVGMRTNTVDNGSATIGGDISGVGSLTVKGTAYNGNMILSGANSFNGGVTLLPGSANTLTLYINNASALGTGPFTINPGTGQAVRFDNNTVAAIVMTPNNTQYWNTNFTFVGTRSLNMGTGAVTIGNNITVTIVSNNTLTVGGITDGGSGFALTKAGAGTLALSGFGTYSGVTTINAGTLQAATNAIIATNSALVVASGATFSNDFVQAVGSISGAGSINVGASGVLSNGFDNTSTTFTGTISGAGAVVKVGAGTLTLTGSNTYSGATTISGGTLLVNKSISAGAGLGVNAGATLGGTGSVNRTVTISEGGLLAAGDPSVASGVGTLSVASLTQQAGCSNIFEFASASSYDQVTVGTASGLVLNGGIIYLYAAGSTNTWDANGVYNLFQYSGTAPSVDSLVVTNATSGKNYVFTAGGGYVTLTISSGGPAVWDGGDSVDSYWQSVTNWAGDTAPADASEIQFDGTTRLINTNDFPANKQFTGITFPSGAGAFTLYGNPINLAGKLVNSNVNLQTVNLSLVLDGNTREINGALGGLALGGNIDDGSYTYGITKTGPYALTLTGTNTYKGTTTISEGILQVGTGGLSGSLGSGPISNAGVLVFNRTGTLSVSNVITGVGSVTNDGAGTVVLAGNSSYSGTTALNAGTLVAQHSNALGSAAAGTVVASGAALQLQTSGGTVAEPVMLGGTGVANDGALRSAGTNTLSGAITLGSAARMNSDSGVLTLSGGITGTGLALTIGGSGNTILATTGLNTGLGGSLVKDGAGTLVVTAAGDFTGGTTISNGTLLVTSDGLLGAAGGMLAFAGGTLQTTNSFTISRPVMVGGGTVNVGAGTSLTLGGVVGGSGGSLTKAGNGLLSLGGSNTNSDGIILNAGTIQLVSGTPLGTGPLTINGGTIYNGTPASITATNTMTWSGNFTYSTPISAGLNVGNGAVTLTTNITVSMGGNGYASLFTIGGNIGESGGSRSLTIASGGSNPSYVCLTGSNTYSGGTVMTGAGLKIGSAQALGTGHFTISGGSLLQNSGVALTGISGQTWDGDFGMTCGPGPINLGTSPLTLVGARSITIDNGYATVGGDISGAGASLTVRGTAYVGYFTLTGSNTFDGGLTLVPGSASTFTLYVNHASALGTGPFTINAGTGQAVQIDNNTSGALTNTWNNTQNWNRSFTFVGSKGLHMGYGAITLGTNVVVSVSASTLTVGGIGDGGQGWSLTKAGAGTLVLAGTGTSSGATLVNAGTLLAATNAVIAPNATLVVAGGALFSNDLVQAVGSISGAGTIGQGATGVLSNGYDNTSTIFSGVIAGAGAMVKDGSGSLTLAGSNTFTGSATLRNGGLLVNGSLAAGTALSVNGGVLGGTGVVNRTVLLTAGGTLNAGDPAVSAGVGTLTVAGLTLEAGGTNVVEFSSISAYDRINVTAASGLTNLGGKVKLLVAGTTDTWDTNGVYNLFQYSGAAPDVSTLSVVNMTAGKDYLFQASGGYVSLTISETIVSGGAAVWDGGDTVNNLWSSATNWVGDTVPTNSSELRFEGTTRLSSVNDLPANTQFIGMTFQAGGGAFTLNGNAVNLAGNLVNSNANLQTVNLPLVLDGNTREFDAVLGDIAVGGAIDDGSETWGITKTGAGTVTLTGANTYDGSTTINAGILQVGDGGGAGTLGYGVVANDSALVLNRTGTLTVSNAIGGVGSITNSGSGTVILAGNSSYSGNTAVNAGTVVAAHANALGGVAAGTTVAGGATLQVQTGGTLAEPVTLNGAGVADGGALRGVGTNTLSGVLTLAGATRVNNDSGVMTLSGGVTGTGRALTLGGAGNITVSSAGLNTGSGGALTKDGVGTLTLTAAGDFTGGTTISNGTVAVNADNVLGTGALELAGGTLRSTNSYTASRGVVIDAAGGTFNIEGSSILTLSGIVSGQSGIGFTKTGPGTLVLGGGNTYAGGTTLNAGVLRLANSTALGTGPLVINGGTLNNTSALTLTTTNDMTWNASFLVDYPISAALDIGRGSVTLTTNITVSVGSSWGTLFVVNGAIGEVGGSRSLTITGASNPGFVNLRGTNTYSGGTILNGSGICIGNTQALGTGPLTINGGTLSQNNGGAALTGVTMINVVSNFGFSCTAGAINLGVVPITLSGIRTFSIDNGGVSLGGTIYGVGGGMVVNGTAFNSSLTLSGSNTFSGGITLSPGTANLTLYANHAAALGTGPLTFSRGSGGNLRFDNSTAVALTNLVNNAQNWNASFTFIGTRNFNLGSGAVTLGTNGVIVTVSNSTLTVGGPIGDGGLGYPLTKAGAGTLVLAGASTYSGLTTVLTGKVSLAAAGALAGDVHVLPGASIEVQSATALADSATLELSTNGATYGVAILSNAAPVVIDTLILGSNVIHEAGTYGSVGSPAMFKYTGYFSGPGVIRVKGTPGCVYTIR